jgi:hypothetical protein
MNLAFVAQEDYLSSLKQENLDVGRRRGYDHTLRQFQQRS